MNFGFYVIYVVVLACPLRMNMLYLWHLMLISHFLGCRAAIFTFLFTLTGTADVEAEPRLVCGKVLSPFEEDLHKKLPLVKAGFISPPHRKGIVGQHVCDGTEQHNKPGLSFIYFVYSMCQ